MNVGRSVCARRVGGEFDGQLRSRDNGRCGCSWICWLGKEIELRKGERCRTNPSTAEN